MRISLRQLQIFRAVAFAGSTSAAAQSLPMSQSAASAALNELEAALEARLFDRVGKRLHLNDNGRSLLPAALALLDGAHDIEASFASGEHSSQSDLKIYGSTTVGNYVIPRLLADYRAQVPRARIELGIGNTLNVVTAVRHFEADLGFIEGPCHASDVIVAPWLKDELVVIAAPGHPLAKASRRGRLSANQLCGAQWLLREPGSGTREAVEQALLTKMPAAQSATTMGSSEAIKNAVAEGLGVSCLSRFVVQDLIEAKRLCVLQTRLPRVMRHFMMIHHRHKILSNSLRRFMAHCQRFAAG
jgi:DNA-binding transcriptional LysR family regulator